ncbi:MAG: PPC domain-containing protein, partial [Gaiellaceae bacterium]
TTTPTQTSPPAPTSPGGGSNDACANALAVPAVPYSGTTTTTTATTEGSDPTPSCGNHSRSKSAWYRFTAPSSGTLTADTFGSTYDTILSVYTGSCGAFTPLTNGCNDDSGSVQSRVSFPATAGSTYYFLVTAYAGNGGTLHFDLTY